MLELPLEWEMLQKVKTEMNETNELQERSVYIMSYITDSQAVPHRTLLDRQTCQILVWTAGDAREPQGGVWAVPQYGSQHALALTPLGAFGAAIGLIS